jgi:serine phosphatase RsbU (regulator of sigma subunit)
VLEFAGAYNPLFLIREGELIQYKADRMPIGYHEKSIAFSTHKINIRKEDTIYLFSDGFPDQFGGMMNKKFTSKKFKQLLMEHSKLSMPEQLKLLETALDDWQGENEQIDDILVLGIRF